MMLWCPTIPTPDRLDSISLNLTQHIMPFCCHDITDDGHHDPHTRETRALSHAPHPWLRRQDRTRHSVRCWGETLILFIILVPLMFVCNVTYYRLMYMKFSGSLMCIHIITIYYLFLFLNFLFIVHLDILSIVYWILIYCEFDVLSKY